MKEQTQRLGAIKITDFGLRHFDPEFGGTKILNTEPKDFEQWLNTFANLYFDKPEEDRWIDKAQGIVRVDILDGYAPFCKLLVMKNITDAKSGTLQISVENYRYLRSTYSARRSDELPVLTRWFDFPPGIEKPRAEYTISVLYSKEQIDKEALAMYEKNKDKEDIEVIGAEPPAPFDADWGVVAILGQMTPKEEPMQPITMLRNYMPIEFGGSGVKLLEKPKEPNHFDFNDQAQYDMSMETYQKNLIAYKESVEKFEKDYKRSVEFWNRNATVK
ncbi:MAG: DUF3228 family protein [Nanoarchaeota archaeon]